VRELVTSLDSAEALYANLAEMLRGDATVFNRGDGAEGAWRIIEHVVTSRIAGDVPVRTCAAGARPPRLGQ